MEDAGALLENGAAFYVPGGSFLPPEAGLPFWLPPTNFFLELFSGHDVFRLTSICGIPWRTPSHSPHYLPVEPRVGLGMCNSCLAH